MQPRDDHKWFQNYCARKETFIEKSEEVDPTIQFSY